MRLSGLVRADAEAGQRRKTRMCWIGAASLTRKETELRGYMFRLARAWVMRTGPLAPPGVVARNGMRHSPWIRASRPNCGWPSENSSAKGRNGTRWRKRGTPALALVESYFTFVAEERKKVGVPVKQATPMLVHTLAQLLQDMRARAQLMASVSDRIAITRDSPVFRGLPRHEARIRPVVYVGFVALRLPKSAGLIFNFYFGKTLRKSVEAVVVLADAECLETCAFRGVTEYISAALRIGCDSTEGYLFPAVEPSGTRGAVAV